jgi:hypothetical protein
LTCLGDALGCGPNRAEQVRLRIRRRSVKREIKEMKEIPQPYTLDS